MKKVCFKIMGNINKHFVFTIKLLAEARLHLFPLATGYLTTFDCYLHPQSSILILSFPFDFRCFFLVLCIACWQIIVNFEYFLLFSVRSIIIVSSTASLLTSFTCSLNNKHICVINMLKYHCSLLIYDNINRDYMNSKNE